MGWVAQMTIVNQQGPQDDQDCQPEGDDNHGHSTSHHCCSEYTEDDDINGKAG
jgi:hypothetical protein